MTGTDHTVAATASADEGVEGNARLTAGTATILLVLLAIEGFTVLSVSGMLTVHAFVGMVLVPVVAVKIASTTYRFAQYYRGNDAYVRRGPPHPILRLLGPLVTGLTIALLASGIVLIVGGRSYTDPWRQIHKLTFVAWFAATTVHVLGHVLETVRVAPRDWVRQPARVAGASVRRALIAASLVAGIALGIVVQPRVTAWHREPSGRNDRDRVATHRSS